MTTPSSLPEKILSHKVQPGLQGIPGVKNIIAIGSGKGGVGKSTVSANLAIALAQAGAKVGLLDADIYGPSQPLIMGAAEAPSSEDKKTINPLLRHGVKIMSIGYLVDTKTPMIWRGPMVSGALQQLLNDTRWGELDYLILDLPPGTGDIQLTMSQKIPVSGAVVVTTPQELSLLDARRAIGMFNKVQIPVLGIVENMSVYECPHCHHADTIFGEHGADTLAKEFNAVVLGKLPLDKSIRADADAGTPTVAAHPESSIAHCYHKIALALAARLSLQAKSYTSKFPKIVIENN